MSPRRFGVLLAGLSGDAVYRQVLQAEPELVDDPTQVAAVLANL